MFRPIAWVGVAGVLGCSKGTATVSRNIIIDTGLTIEDDEAGNPDPETPDTGFSSVDSGAEDTATEESDTGSSSPDTGSTDTAESASDTAESVRDTGILDTGSDAMSDDDTALFVGDTGVAAADRTEDTGASTDEDTAASITDTGAATAESESGTATGSEDESDAGVDTSDAGEDSGDSDTAEVPDTAEVSDAESEPDSGLETEPALEGPGPGSIFITEIMANPDAVSDLDGEWFEVYNPRGSAYSLRGCRFTSPDGDAFTVDTDLEIGPWSRVVFGVNSDPDENGGAEVDYLYKRLDFSLDNFEDRIRLINADGVVVSAIGYDREWDREAGSSLQLDRDSHYRAAASDASNWCVATTEMSGGDRGTPHAVNVSCTSVDHDGDGYSSDDCDDADPSIFPGSEERWDGLDNDCDGVVDDFTEASAGVHLEGQETDYLGWYNALSTGDVTGDGHPDVLAGGSWVLSGGVGGIWVLDGTRSDEWVGTIADWDIATIEGGGDSSYGATMGPRMGDANADGVADVLVVGTDAYDSSAAAGVYAGSLFYGGASLSGDFVESDADVLFTSSMAGYWYVSALSDVDFDADGHDDIFVGNYLATTLSRGDVFFFSGVDLGEDTVYELSDDADVHLQGNSNGDFFGYSLAAADLTADGYVEVLSAAAGEDHEGADRSGCVYMVSQSAVADASGLTTAVSSVSSFKICGVEAHVRLGRNAAPQLFDVNRDGSFDIVLSAPGARFGGKADEGAVYVFFNDGDWSGVRTVAAADVTLTSGDADYFGNAMHHGDFDGDGVAELAVGAPGSDSYDDTVDQPGQVHLYRSALLESGGIIPVEEASLTILGSGLSGFGSTIRSADLDDNGVDELIVAAHRWNDDKGRVGIFALN